jgi:hypothetical protein
MFKFAHMSDCHIGAWRDPQLRELNIRAFEQAIDKCIEEKVNFILICGDLFDDNLPDLPSVQRACVKMHEAREDGIAIYVIYGSHDYSANLVSMIDVLNSAGLFTKVATYESTEEGKLRLKFFTDANTGVKITGISGRRTSIETDYYAKIDQESIRSESGFKILLFHSVIAELKPKELVYSESVPASAIPQSFNYYAGGHLHKRMEHTLNLGHIAYPGPLFGGEFRDLELTADGESRGFFIVRVNDQTSITSKFVQVSVCEFIHKEIDGERKSANQLREDLLKVATTSDVTGKLVLLKVKGTLSSGRPADIDFSQVRQTLLERGAMVAQINRYSLTTRETTRISVHGENRQEIEDKLLHEHIGKFKLDPAISDESVRKAVEERFVGDKGIENSKSLLSALKTEQKENENRTTHETRVLDTGRAALKLSD